MNKLKMLSILGVICCLPFTSLIVNAADYHESYETDYENMVDGMFEGLDEDALVLEMPEGGFLYGQCTDYDANNPTIVLGEYDSETDKNSITVSEAKEKLLSEINEGGIELFGATPPESNTLRTLNYGDVYTSKPFSGSGWRFSNLQFKPASGTGKYLRWSSYVDSGRVGNYNEGYATKYGGSEQGTSVKAGATIWNSEDGLGQIYYTYNPIAGTYYVVANVNP